MGSVTNVASASGKDPNQQTVTSPTGTKTVAADQQPELSIEKSASPETYASLGQKINYSYLVTNEGNVTISDPFSIDDDKATDESCPAGDLAPGGSRTCSASHTINQADLDAGFVTNVASASGKDPQPADGHLSDGYRNGAGGPEPGTQPGEVRLAGQLSEPGPDDQL